MAAPTDHSLNGPNERSASPRRPGDDSIFVAEEDIGHTENQEKSEDGAQNPDDAHLRPLETGLLAWSQVLAALLGNCMAWGNPTTFGVYQLHYQETLGLPSSQISWIGSVQVFLVFVLCSVSGRLADAGYARATVWAGAFFSALGIFMTSLATEYWQIFLAQGICTGLGLGLVFMPCVSVLSSYFYKRRAFVLAIAATGTGFGAIAFPALVQYLTPVIGFPWAVRCHAFLALLVAGTEGLLLRPRLAGRKTGPMFEFDAFTEPSFFLFSAGTFLFFWIIFFGYFYINAYARNIIGFDVTSSVQLLLITNAVGIPVRPIVGWVANNYLGTMNTYIISLVVLSGMQFVWIAVQDRLGMYLFAVFYGIGAAMTQSIFIGALASLTEDPTKMGARSGIVYLVSSFATMAGPPTAGAIIDRSGGNYLWAQVWAGIVVALGAGLVAGSRCWKTGMIWRVKA